SSEQVQVGECFVCYIMTLRLAFRYQLAEGGMNACADEDRSPPSPPPRTHSALTIPPPSARVQARSATHAAS
ncbi:MAG: hypothetical protein ACRYE7_02025, partial [Janthinobacterium lividum]